MTNDWQTILKVLVTSQRRRGRRITDAERQVLTRTLPLLEETK